MRERDVLPLVAAGTIAIHVLLMVAIDVGGVYARRDPPPPAPRIELVDILPSPPPPPPPPPAPAPPAMAKVEEVKVERRAPTRALVIQREPVPPPIPPADTAPAEPGGAPVVHMDLGADAVGTVPVAPGQRRSERVGQGGTGTGTGSGDGAGSAAPVPVSVAAIKTAAKPRGDYGYFNAAADYPPDARRLGVEGRIRVRLLVDAGGKVAERRLLKPGLGHGLDEVAMGRAARFEFDPAVDTTGKPVASVVVWTFNFTLPE